MKKNKKIKVSLPERIFQCVNYVLLLILAVVCIYPMWHVLMASFSKPNKIIRHQGALIKPLGFSIQAYKQVLSNPNILSGYKNTLIILVSGVVVCLFMTSLGAYVLSRKNLMWKKPITIFIMITMFISGGLIPFYLNLKSLHLTNTLAGIVVPFMINTYNMIILRTAFESIPDSLIDAAEIDGASHLKILTSIVLPLSKPTLSVMVLYYGVEKWNGWFWASAILRDRNLLPLQVILREILLSST